MRPRLSGIGNGIAASPRRHRCRCCGSYPCSHCSSSAPTHGAPAHSHLASLRALSRLRARWRRRTSGLSCKSSAVNHKSYASLSLACAHPRTYQRTPPPTPPQNTRSVGGGIIGASILYQLTLKGYKPILLERSQVAAAASGKSGGFLGRWMWVWVRACKLMCVDVLHQRPIPPKHTHTQPQTSHPTNIQRARGRTRARRGSSTGCRTRCTRSWPRICRWSRTGPSPRSACRCVCMCVQVWCVTLIV